MAWGDAVGKCLDLYDTEPKDPVEAEACFITLITVACIGLLQFALVHLKLIIDKCVF